MRGGFMAIVLASTENMSNEEWLDWRKQGIGGSDAGVVCGINKYKSPVELWMEKTEQMPPQEAGEAAYWGNRLESLVTEEFTLRTGNEVIPVHQILQNEEHQFMLANLDGLVKTADGEFIFEAKTTSVFNSSEWENSVPDIYMLQLQHYMAVTGTSGAYIAVLIGGNSFRWKFVDRDEELISMLIKLESDFWNHVQTSVPPALDGTEASAKFISEKFPNSVPKARIELPESAAELIIQYDEASEKAKWYEEQKKGAENLLKQILGNHESGSVNDKIVTWKSVTQERLDSKTLKVEHPTLYKKYATKNSFRRFSIKAAI